MKSVGLELLGYVNFIQDEKVKFQCFFNGVPVCYRDKITYDEPRTLKECVWKAKFPFEQSKNRHEVHKSINGKLKERKDVKEKQVRLLDEKKDRFTISKKPIAKID